MKMKQSFKIIFKTLLIYLVLWLDFWYFDIRNGKEIQVKPVHSLL